MEGTGVALKPTVACRTFSHRVKQTPSCDCFNPRGRVYFVRHRGILLSLNIVCFQYNCRIRDRESLRYNDFETFDGNHADPRKIEENRTLLPFFLLLARWVALLRIELFKGRVLNH